MPGVCRLFQTAVFAKVPAVTLGFWIIEIAATTLGDTGGDTVTMTMNLGYLVGTAIFFSILIVTVALQIAPKKFHPYLYWATIVASTTCGTTLADFADRSLGIGCPGGSLLPLACVLASLAVWYWSEWAAFILTRPLGATVGDFFDKPMAQGGLNFSRPRASLSAVFITACLLLLPQRPGTHPGDRLNGPPIAFVTSV